MRIAAIGGIRLWPTAIVDLLIAVTGYTINNYPPKWRWLAVDIYWAAERRGKYLTLVTDTEWDNCFSICPVNEQIWKIVVLNTLK